jgi:phenylalanyl-tRNA synthetase alpha chain
VPAVCPLSAAEVRHALAIRDLTDPSQGHHAIQILIDAAERALADRWGVAVQRRRANPVVTVADNYDRLGYAPDAAARDARYSRYLTDELMLRAHTSAGIPAALEELVAIEPGVDVVLSCPGIVYRRDVIDASTSVNPTSLTCGASARRDRC